MGFTKRAAKVALLCAAFVMAGPFNSVVAEAGSNCFQNKPAELGFFNKINVERRSRSRVQLRLDPHLTKVARKHSREMTARNLLHHTSTTNLRRRVTHWQTLGENVGVGGTVESLHRAFMESPSHRENVLYGSFRHVGIGTRERHGRLWVTVVFEAETNPGTTLRMPSCFSR